MIVIKNGALNIYAIAVLLYGNEWWIIFLQMERRGKRLLSFSMDKVLSNEEVVGKTKYVTLHIELEIHNSFAHDEEKGRSV